METGLLDSASEGKGNKQLMIWRIVSLILLVSLITIVILYVLGIRWKEKEEKMEPDSILNLWNKGSTIFSKLVPYMNEITNKDTKISIYKSMI